MKLYYTTFRFEDNSEYIFSADIKYYVDMDGDIYDFEVKDFDCLNPDENYVEVVDVKKKYYNFILEGILTRPGYQVTSRF